MTKAFDTWTDRLDTGRLTKAQISQAAQVMARAAKGLQRRGKTSALTDGECIALAQRLFDNPVLLTEEHTAQGIDWLARHGRKELGLSPELHSRLISGFHHFTWRGEIELFGVHGSGTAPIWHVHLNDGTEFAYFYASGWRGRGLWKITPS